jgi:hypothetical protein
MGSETFVRKNQLHLDSRGGDSIASIEAEDSYRDGRIPPPPVRSPGARGSGATLESMSVIASFRQPELKCSDYSQSDGQPRYRCR